MCTASVSWAFRTQLMCLYLVTLSLQMIFMFAVAQCSTRCSAVSPIWKSSSSCASLLRCRWPHKAAGHFLSLHACSPDNPHSKWWPPVQTPSLSCSAKQHHSVKSYKMKNTVLGFPSMFHSSFLPDEAVATSNASLNPLCYQTSVEMSKTMVSFCV